MSGWITMAAGVTRFWVNVYTRGLSRDDRGCRRDEIESDLWEHQRDGGASDIAPAAVAIEVIGRVVRGIPADVLWRFRMEGPKMEINIPFERVAGALLLALVAMMVVTGAISGYDTNPDGFDQELTRLADLNALADNMNVVFRLFTGLGLIGAAAGFYVALHRRSHALSAIAAFGLVAAGVLALVAGALQIAFVDLAEEYVSTSGARQEQVLVTARAVALVVEATTFSAFVALLLGTYTLAVLLGRERLVPRWAIGLPALSAGLLVTLGIANAFGAGDDATWLAVMGGALCEILWLLIAGFYLIFKPSPQILASAPSDQPAPI